MSSIEQLFEKYAVAFRSGDKDPRPFLRAAPEGERDELSRLIELFLMRADPQEWDADAFAGSEAERLAERILPAVMPEIHTPDRGWSYLLPRLRMQNRITRRDASALLASALGAEDDSEGAKVRDYYHDMEYGNLEPQGVSRRVLDSLAEIYGVKAVALRRAGEMTLPSGSAGGQVYARTFGDADHAIGMESPGDSQFSRISGKPDWIDRLFTGAGNDDPNR